MYAQKLWTDKFFKINEKVAIIILIEIFETLIFKLKHTYYNDIIMMIKRWCLFKMIAIVENITNLHISQF